MAARDGRGGDAGWARTRASVAARTAVRRTALPVLLRSGVRVVVEGADRLRDVEGPTLIVSNHTSHLDTPLVLTTLPRRLARRTAVGAAADYFFAVPWRAYVTAAVFNTFPVARLGDRTRRGLTGRLLDDGWSVLLFPEGTRSRDGSIGAFNPGVARLCVGRGLPCLPIGIDGAYDVLPRGGRWHPATGDARPLVTVRYGEPLRPRPGETADAFNDRLRATVVRLRAPQSKTGTETGTRTETGTGTDTGGASAGVGT